MQQIPRKILADYWTGLHFCSAITGLVLLVIQIVCSQSGKECVQNFTELFDILPITIENHLQLKAVQA